VTERVRVSGLLAAIGVVICCVAVSCDKQPAAPLKMMSAKPSSTPNVIVISFDTVRADCLGCYGHPWIETPHIDEFAKESILFEACMSVAPTTLASHTSLFTGTYPHTHGVPRNGFVVNEKNVMLAEVLREAGYHTAGFPASFTLNSRFNFHQGFDHYDDEENMPTGSDSDWDGEQRSAENVTDAVLDYLDTTEPDGPVFLFVHYWDPHAPYRPPSPYLEKYLYRESETAPGTVIEQERRDELVDKDWVLGVPRPDYENEVRDYVRLYAGEISYMDEHVGRLFRGLRDRGIFDKSIVAVTSDHGETLWDHEPYFTHGWDTYQASVHVVCIVRLPGGKHGGTKVSVPISNIDVMPSVLGYLGLAVPERVEGRTIDFTQPGEDTPARTLYSQATKPFDVEAGQVWPNTNKTRCARAGTYTFIQFPSTGDEELYDLSIDPTEQYNLLSDPNTYIAPKTAVIRNELELWVNSADPLPSEYESRNRHDTIKRLKTVGYAR